MKFVNHGWDGEPYGYTCRRLPLKFILGFIPRSPVYHIHIDIKHPLYYVDDDGRKLTTRREFDSDLASIPAPIDRLWSTDEFEISAIIHDDGCHSGGLYEINAEGRYNFIHISRIEMDRLMKRMAMDECRLLGLDRTRGGRLFCWITQHCIYAGVRIGAFLGFGKPEKKDPKYPIDTGKFPIAFA